MTDLTWILLTAALAAISCSFAGLHLVLRKQAMLSDALSHSVLPGIVIIYILFNQLSLGSIFVGAIAVSLMMSISMEFIRQQKLLREDAAMGLVFSTLFAIGVVLLENFAGSVHIDTQCLLYGELAFVPLENPVTIGSFQIPESTHHLFWMGLLVLSLGYIFHKELLLASFHEEMAQSMGLPIKWIQYGILLLTSVIVMASFRSLGAILVIAFLILPANFGSLFSKSFWNIYKIGLIYIFASILLGTFLAFQWDNNLGAMIVSVAFITFLIAYSIVRLRAKSPRRHAH